MRARVLFIQTLVQTTAQAYAQWLEAGVQGKL